MNPQFYAAQVEPPFQCGRVIAHDRESYLVTTAAEDVRARIRGALRLSNGDPSDYPVVGDYVQLSAQEGVIHHILPRKNLFARRSVDESHDLQPIAANLDRLFIAVALNKNFNIRRIERYIVAASAFDVPVAVLLTKMDLVDNVAEFAELVRTVTPRELEDELPVLAVSAVDGTGLEQLARFRGPGQTLAFVGSSGVGKSTLLNVLLGKELMATGEIRILDDRGKHTTTRRMLQTLEDGTAIIDTPGMREFALANAEQGVATAFGDIEDLAQQCRFTDCRHVSEPGCAVRDSLTDDRLQSWRKLEREAAFQARRSDPHAMAAERNRWKAIQKDNRRRARHRDDARD